MVGTTNTAECLPNDIGGNRRFVPVELKGGSPGKIKPYFDEHREHLWAEAVVLYHAGEEAWLPPKLHHVQRVATERHREQDELIENEVARLPTDRFRATEEIVVACGRDPGKITMGDLHRFGNALKKMGWTKDRRTVDGWTLGKSISR